VGDTFRSLSALCLAIVMVGSIGVVPVASLAQAVGRAANSDALALASAEAAAALRGLQRWDGGPVAVRPVFSDVNRPIEVIIELGGRSLAAEQSFRAAMGMPSLDGAAQRAYVASVRASHADVRTAIAAAGGTVRYDYAIVYNGIAAVLDRAALLRIAGMPGIVHISPTQVATIALDQSVPFILGDKTYEELGADGTGVRIAVIDTGIDYTHAAFGGSGIPDEYGANDPTVIEDGTFPTAKVIGGTDLVGENYDARGATAPGGACSSTPTPDPDPLDVNGHGTHSSDTAAGMTVEDGDGNVLTPHGVAPGASLYMIKIFSGCAVDGTASTSNANVIAAIEWATDPNQDGDTSDHADVINMSLGGAFGRDTEAGAQASDAAVDVGVIVVASAGNSGNIPYITGAPAAATEAISVAAGNDPGIKLQLLTVANSAGADGDKESVEGAFTPPLAESGTKSGLAARLGDFLSPAARLCTALPAGSLTGKIPLVSRGACTFQLKVENAQAAGAIAVVVYNNVGGDPIVMGGTGGVTIPAVMVSMANGNALTTAIDADTTFTLDPANQKPIPDRLAPFTSRGPRFNDASIKPDVTAPGVSILSALVGSGTGATSVSGTSFSSPHVAGAAAILRQLHPDWSVEEIKSLLMNTATDAKPGTTTPYATSLMGAGRVRVDVAATTESVVVPGSASFGVAESSASGTMQYDVNLELRNKGDASKSFDLTSAFRVPTDIGGAITLVHPASVSVDAGGSTDFTLSLVVNYNTLGGSLFEKDGFLTLTESGGGDVLRVPFLLIPIARSAAHASASDIALGSSFTVQNSGIRATRVDVYQLGATSPNEDLIAEPNGLPNDPDDWFDIRATGARSFGKEPVGSKADQVLEWGISVWGRRSAPSLLVTDIVINVDGGAPDYLVEVADLGLLTTGSFNGAMASAVFSLNPKPGKPSGFLEFVVPNTLHASWQSAPLFLADLNTLARANNQPKIGLANEPFSYVVVTTDLETGSFDVSPVGMFNAKQVQLDAVPNIVAGLAPGPGAGITAVGATPGGLLLIYRNNVAGADQSEVVTVHA